MTRRSMLVLCALALPALALFSACGSKAEAGQAALLRFTAIPDDNTTELREKFKPLAAWLSEQLDVPVEYVPTASYVASVEAFKNGDVQLAWFGGLTGVQARAAVPGARAIAQGKVDPTFKSYFIAHRDTGLERSDEFPMALEGLSFTFGSDNSTSGRLMPEAFIREHTGRSPREFFGAQNHYSGSHDKTAMLVQSGTFQAGALNYKTYDGMVADGEIDPAVCRIVWVTPEYADYNFTAHPSLDETYGAGFTEKLKRTLISIERPELLAAVSRPEGLIEATNEDFAAIEVLSAELGFVRE
jgi:phosphonate transport system substrate-binding protein